MPFDLEGDKVFDDIMARSIELQAERGEYWLSKRSRGRTAYSLLLGRGTTTD
jgi:hypothetical protein